MHIDTLYALKQIKYLWNDEEQSGPDKHSDFKSSFGRKAMAKLKLHFLKEPENVMESSIQTRILLDLY